MPLVQHTDQPRRDPTLRERRIGTAWQRLLARAAEALRHARETRELTSLDDRELRDIGVNSYEVAQELRRGRPALPREEADALVARAHQARSAALFQALTGWTRRQLPPGRPDRAPTHHR